MTKFFRIFVFLLIAFPWVNGLWAASFTSTDGVFTLDLPPGWIQANVSAPNTVLALRKNTAAMDIKSISCTTEKCLDEKINHDLLDVKSKKMTVVTNTYTGEEIKRIEFSTGEPLYYISFFTSKNDFSAGYFLINDHAYSILAKNITYAEADLLFSFFSPLRHNIPSEETLSEPTIEVDHSSPRSYETAALPEVEVEPIEAPIVQEDIPETASQEVSDSGSTTPKESILQKIKQYILRIKSKTLVSSQMPSYIRILGHGFDVLMIGFCLYFLIWLSALATRLFVKSKVQVWEAPKNSSPYPIVTKRLYGTPALILRTKDNKGNVLISYGSRWNSICVCFGMLAIVITLFVLSLTSLSEQFNTLSASTLTYATIYSICSLTIPLGILLILTGIIWGILILREITLFDREGKKAAVIVQKGFPLLYEEYEIYFANSRKTLHLLRKRFSLLRHWELLDAQGIICSTFVERSLPKSIFRRLLGHLWGLLRTDYNIMGPAEQQGTMESTHALFNSFICNVSKPEELSSQNALAATALISLRDRDKWYPWFN